MANESITPEVIDDPSKLPRDLQALHHFAYLMDDAFAIPGTRRRVGIDAAVGLIPGVGDAIGAILSSWILFSAMRHRVPIRIVSRMLVNILIDLGVGAIPVIGDVFDFFWKENIDNVALLMRHRNRRLGPRSFRAIAFGIFVVLFVVLLAAVAAVAGVAIVITHMMRSS
jgi:hypothetical protein